MKFITLKITNNKKILVNLNKVRLFIPSHTSKQLTGDDYHLSSIVIFSDQHTEKVAESTEEIERLINGPDIFNGVE